MPKTKIGKSIYLLFPIIMGLLCYVLFRNIVVDNERIAPFVGGFLLFGGIYTIVVLVRIVLSKFQDNLSTVIVGVGCLLFPLTIVAGLILFIPLYCLNIYRLGFARKIGAYNEKTIDRKTCGFASKGMLFLVPAIILIVVLANNVLSFVEKNKSGATPKELFEQIYTNGVYLGEYSDEFDTVVLGKTAEGESVVWLIKKNDAGLWSAVSQMNWRLGKMREKGYFSINVASCTKTNLDLIVVSKYLMATESEDKLGISPYDNMNSTFHLVKEENPLGIMYHYVTLVDCDTDGYAVVGW